MKAYSHEALMVRMAVVVGRAVEEEVYSGKLTILVAVAVAVAAWTGQRWADL
jgi:hypothetical protein